jgi:hypothetical protein
VIEIVSIKDINKSIVTQITTELNKSTNYKNVTFSSTDIKEGIKRPSLYIAFDKNKKSPILGSNIERDIDVNIYYFSSSPHCNKLENMEMQEIIENALSKYLKVTDTFFIPIFDINSIVTDGVLICSFNLYTLEEAEETEEYELMEALEITNAK